MTSTVSNAVARQDNSATGLVHKYESDFVSQLPSHIRGEQWIGTAIGALRRDPAVAEAANNNVGVFLSALLNAARLGLEPGTEQFYLVPQSPRKGAPKEILGVVGYQGIVELIYRAGAVSSVIVECVYTSDRFSYAPGRDERPVHEIDWDADDRGELRLVYAYAVMKDGATSKVVVLNKADINRIRASSASARSDYSPWSKHPAAMWMKSAARQLAKWVPTSAEYRREQLRAAQDVMAERASEQSAGLAEVATGPEPGAGEHIDPMTGEVQGQPDGDEPVEGELMPEGYDPSQEPEGWRS